MLNLGRCGIPYIYNDLHLSDEEINQFRKHNLLSEFYIDWAGQFDKVYNNYASERTLEEHLLVYCYEGRGDLFVQGKHYDIVPGTLFFLKARIKHTYGNVENGYWSGYWVHFHGSISDELVDSCFDNSLEVKKIGDDAKLQELYKEILDSLNIGHCIDDTLHASNVLRYMLTYIKHAPNTPTANTVQEQRIKKIIAFMNNNISNPLTLEQLADEVHLSKYHFAHYFKKHTGFTPMYYFLILRINQACNLLIQKDRNVQEISSLLGFENPYYFSSVFKRMVGCAPSHFSRLKGIEWHKAFYRTE